MRIAMIIAGIVLVFMLLDIISGLIWAIKNGEYKSAVMRNGLYHKLGYIMAIILCALIEYTCTYIDLGFNLPILKPVMIYIIINEIGSIIENLEKINPEILPEKIRKILKTHEGSGKNEDSQKTRKTN